MFYAFRDFFRGSRPRSRTSRASIGRPVGLSACLSVGLAVCPSSLSYLSFCPSVRSVCVSVGLSVCWSLAESSESRYKTQAKSEAKSGHEVSLLSPPELKLAGNSSACGGSSNQDLATFLFVWVAAE